MLGAAQQIDQRQTPRFRVDRPGSVVLANGKTVECTIRDLGPLGARLEFADRATILPKRFELKLGESEATARVRLLWQHRDWAGVLFDADPKPTGFWAAIAGLGRGLIS